jgi:hypothetical protein
MVLARQLGLGASAFGRATLTAIAHLLEERQGVLFLAEQELAAGQ